MSESAIERCIDHCDTAGVWTSVETAKQARAELAQLRRKAEEYEKLMQWLDEACVVLDGLLSRSSGQTLTHPWSDACRATFGLETPDYLKAAKEVE